MPERASDPSPPTATVPLALRVRMPEHVVVRSFANETVVLNLHTQQFHGLNPTAGRMLEVIGQQTTLRRALAVLAADYGKEPSEIEPHLHRLVGDLESRGLLVVDE